MQQMYVVRFARDDPETPPTMDAQIALARKAAEKLGVPNAESKPLYRVGRNSHTGEAWAYVEWTWEGFGRDRGHLELVGADVFVGTGTPIPERNGT